MFLAYFVLAFGLALLSLDLAAQSGKQPPIDLSDPAHIETGKALFNGRCSAYCHGNEGSGGRTPAFKGNSSLKTEEVFQVITEGRTGADVMPSYASTSEKERWELVAYIMYLSRQPADPNAQ